jgi:tripartite-type tricarboxylate transporter receptor subunit TctC
MVKISMQISPEVKVRYFQFAAGCVVMAALPVAYGQGSAAPYPSRTVMMVVPFAPGGGTDIEGRTFANKLSENLGRQFVLDYKPGAAMTIGMSYAAKAAPDGYTVLFVSANYSLVPIAVKDLPYDPTKVFAPVSLLSKRSALMVVHPSLPAKNVKEYIALARARPGEINFATGGPGGIQHLTGAWLNSLTKTKTTFIHYKSSALMVPDMLAGRSHITPMSFPLGLPLVKSGKLRALGVASLERNPLMPDLPTFAEQGVPGFEYSTWLGLVAPAQTPAAIISKLNDELVKVARSPDVAQKLGDETRLIGSTPEQFRQHIATETERWRKLVKEAGIKFDE